MCGPADHAAQLVVASLAFLLSQIDPKQIVDAKGEVLKSPFFDVKLDLNSAIKGDEAVFFSPILDGANHVENPSVMGCAQ